MAKFHSARPKVVILSVDSSTKSLRLQRERVSRACDSCRSKKKKCDGLQPCSLCKVLGIDCGYGDRRCRGSGVNSNTPVGESIKVKRSSGLGGSIQPLDLPDKSVAVRLIQKTWDNVCVLFRFLYRPSVLAKLDSLYEARDLSQLDSEQEKTLALVYSVMAVGALFSKRDLDKSDVINRDFHQDEGYNYFLKAQSLINITSINDIYSIQTMFMLTMFLQCSGNLKKCYSYIGIALRASISEGLHRKNSLTGPTPIEDETKKRLFWSVYKVDMYMSCVLGLPQSISQEAINQDFPEDVDDEKVTISGIINQEPGKISSCGMNNEHTKLMLIMSRIHESLYPVLKWDEQTYIKITDFQEQLDQWLLKLPLQLSPNYEFFSQEDKDYYYKPNRLLYLDYLLAKIILYKPFIHYIGIDLQKTSFYDFQHSMAENCINIAHEVIILSNQMIENNLLSGSYWFSIHTIFFSVTCLMFYQHQIDLGLASKSKIDVQKDCDVGIRSLLKLKNSTSAGERSFNALNSIFKEFNRKTMDSYLKVKETISLLNHQTDPGPIKNIDNVLPFDLVTASTEADAILDQLLQDFDIPMNNIVPDFQMTSFLPKQVYEPFQP